ncbi:phosphoglycerate kinase [Candidatus Nanohalovita haloferacivicina]|uniref:phosphoglycerate kinase n=1 Tax=Candidatus Nanohalovita haloferacivicina TaxID=2978046 RepID=UPI00325F9ABC|nr:Phosphoglycerate kinase [Candidatus Nanohalobia archaeon BNXNv]
MNSIEDIDVKGQKLLLRTDLNLPVEDGEPQKTVRFRRYLKTIEELSDRGAKTVIMAHQGRPGRNDFLSLEEHAEILSESMDKEVEFIPGFFGSELSNTVEEMQEGDVALIENVRFLSEELRNASPEQHAQDIFVNKMAPEFDIYVDDAFSAAHRSHGSMVGFTEKLDSYAGPVMKNELESCGKVRDEFENGLLVLGGEKPSDLIGIMEEMIESVDKVLMGGVPGELALMIQGHELGEKAEWIQEHGFDSKKDELKEMLENYNEKIILPEDVTTESGNYKVGEVPDEMTWDIGPETAENFAEEIRNAESVVMKGPMGAFEEHPEGTRKVVEAMAKSEAYTVLGGGHTSSLVQRFGYELEDFSHVSIAGGAFVRYLSGEKLAAVEALK